jgi:hypothetical protein
MPGREKDDDRGGPLVSDRERREQVGLYWAGSEFGLRCKR